MGIEEAEQTKLQRYYSSAHLFWRSTFGEQLERAALARAARSSMRKYGPKRPWNWNPANAITKVAPDQQIVVKSAQSTEAHSPRLGLHDDLVLHAEVSRRLTQIYRAGAAGPNHSKTARMSYVVLASYYGDRGAMWAAASQDRWYGDGPRRELAYSGVGPGVIASLFPLTQAGQELLRRERLATVVASRVSTTPPTVEQKAKIKLGKLALRAAIGSRQEAVIAMRAKIEGLNAAIAWMTAEAAAIRSTGARGRRAVYKRIEAARRRTEALIFSITAETANIELLRTSGIGSLYANPVPDPSTEAALADAAAAREAWKRACAPILDRHAAALARYEEARRIYDYAHLGLFVGPKLPNGSFWTAGSAPQHPGPAPELDDAHLPPEPVAPMPPARLYAGPARHEHSELSDDDRLRVALLLHISRPTSERGRLITLAHAQATALLTQAWTDWAATGAPAQRPRPHPNDRRTFVSDEGQLRRRDTWASPRNKSPSPREVA